MTSLVPKSLFSEVTQLHASNIENATRTAENAIRIGVLLHQIKELLPHGEFLTAVERELKSLPRTTAFRYMRLAEERLIEEKATLQIADAKPADADMPTDAIDCDRWEAAQKEVAEMSWLKITAKGANALSKGIRGKDLMDLYRDYGIVRAKEPVVYHPRKPMTPEQQVEAETKQATALVDGVLQQISVLRMDLDGTTGKCAALVHPAKWKELHRACVALNKVVKPLTKRKSANAKR